MCERELETEQNCNILTLHNIGPNRLYFPFSWAAQPGAWGLSLSGTYSSIQHLISNSSDPQLWLIRGLRAPSAGCWLSLPHLVSNWLNFLCTELYNSLRPPSSYGCHKLHSFNPSTVKDILDRMHLLFTQVHFLFWLPGRVGGQYTTISRHSSYHSTCCELFPLAFGSGFSLESERQQVSYGHRAFSQCFSRS